MSDLIDRESAIVRACAVIKDDYVAYDVVQALKALPSAQPEKHTEERTETHACDCISRQDAIDEAYDLIINNEVYRVVQVETLMGLPSAQPQLDTCPIYGGMCGYPSNLCYECPRHEGAKERPQWWAEGLQPFAQPRHYHEENLLTYAHDMGVTLEQAKKELTMVSQIAPQRIKGRWERKESDLSWWYECSECGESPLFDPYENEVRTPFCPWCGARMEEEEDG